MSKASTLGERGETAAAWWYRCKGYRVQARNYRTRGGEIDLIVRKKELLVFVEVKARSADSIAQPCEFVTPAKQRRILQAARGYLAQLGGEEPFVRFDVMEVVQTAQGRLQLHCIENAFS